MRYPKFKGITLIYDNDKNLSSIKDICEYLARINDILKKSIPLQYINLCHFGAIDKNKETAILFVDEPKVFHILRTMSEHILRSLSNNGYYFEAILFKVKPNHKNKDNQIRYKKLKQSDKDRLSMLAQSIGKPEAIHEYIEPINDNEVDL